MMEEKETVSTAVKNPKNAVEFTRAVFGWDNVSSTSEQEKDDSDKKGRIEQDNFVDVFLICH